MPTPKALLLQKYGLSPADLLRQGMEAEVYALGPDAVLKLYQGTTTLAHLTTLQNFYNTLQPSPLAYALPHIQTVAAEGDICLSIERHLPGTPMAAILPTLGKEQIDHVMRAYLAAALALTALPVPADFARYKLFDAEDLSHRVAGDWHQFLAHYLTHKLAQVAPYLRRDVADFAAKVQHLEAILAQPYIGLHHVIHGDFFPGNLLVDAQHQVTALLDFGLFTMYGEALFDIATGWVFFDMYDELKANLRERLLAITLETLGQAVRGKLYRYVLIFSVLAANAYSPTCADGHYQWCVANLNNPAYWRAVE